MLLEKSLAMTGEIVEANSVWQGTPAERVFEYDESNGMSPSSSSSGDLFYTELDPLIPSGSQKESFQDLQKPDRHFYMSGG
jgi:hypothetical protein